MKKIKTPSMYYLYFPDQNLYKKCYLKNNNMINTSKFQITTKSVIGISSLVIFYFFLIYKIYSKHKSNENNLTQNKTASNRESKKVLSYTQCDLGHVIVSNKNSGEIWIIPAWKKDKLFELMKKLYTKPNLTNEEVKRDDKKSICNIFEEFKTNDINKLSVLYNNENKLLQLKIETHTDLPVY